MASEETGEELADNVASLSFDLKALVACKRLLLDYVYVDRSDFDETGEYDLEGLFIRLGHAIDSIKAKRVVLDTIEGLFAGLPNQAIVRTELRRLFRWLKQKGVTVVMTGERGDGTLTRYGLEEYFSDCVISLDHRVVDQVTTRRIRVVKYRGSMHGTKEYPFLIEKDGISIWPITSAQIEHTASRELVPTGIASRHHARQRILPREQHSCVWNRRHRQDKCGGDFWRGCLSAAQKSAMRSMYSIAPIDEVLPTKRFQWLCPSTDESPILWRNVTTVVSK